MFKYDGSNYCVGEAIETAIQHTNLEGLFPTVVRMNNSGYHEFCMNMGRRASYSSINFNIKVTTPRTASVVEIVLDNTILERKALLTNADGIVGEITLGC